MENFPINCSIVKIVIGGFTVLVSICFAWRRGGKEQSSHSHYELITVGKQSFAVGEASGTGLLILNCYCLINALSVNSACWGLPTARSLTNAYFVLGWRFLLTKEKHRALLVIEQRLCAGTNRMSSVTKLLLWHGEDGCNGQEGVGGGGGTVTQSEFGIVARW